MPFRKGATLVLLLLSTPPVSAAAAEVPLPDALAAPGETVVLTAHAVGMQIYECKAGMDGKLAWAFREQLATLIADGKIVGRHFAGPTWELSDGSAVVGRVVASTLGATINDIAWLKLDVVSRRACERHDGTAHQYGRREARRCLRQAGRQPQHALYRGLRVPTQGLSSEASLSARDSNRRRLPMLFMVIERFRDCDPIPVYKRVRDQGIKFPEGLTYVGSWIEPNFDRCFQLMECDDARLLQEWVLNCQGLGMTFEIVPVVPSKETREVVAPFLDSK